MSRRQWAEVALAVFIAVVAVANMLGGNPWIALLCSFSSGSVMQTALDN